jgi:hypothetical protein
LHRAEFFSFIIRLFPAACKQDIPPLPPKQASHGTPTPCPPGGRLGCAVPYRKQAASSRAPRLAVNRLFFLARQAAGHAIELCRALPQTVCFSTRRASIPQKAQPHRTGGAVRKGLPFSSKKIAGCGIVG